MVTSGVTLLHPHSRALLHQQTGKLVTFWSAKEHWWTLPEGHKRMPWTWDQRQTSANHRFALILMPGDEQKRSENCHKMLGDNLWCKRMRPSEKVSSFWNILNVFAVQWCSVVIEKSCPCKYHWVYDVDKSGIRVSPYWLPPTTRRTWLQGTDWRFFAEDPTSLVPGGGGPNWWLTLEYGW